MYPAAGFGLRDSLYPVYPAFILQKTVRSVTFNQEDEGFDPVLFGKVAVKDLHLKTMLFGKPAVHPEDIPGEKRRLFTPGTGPNLNDGVPDIVRVFSG